MPTSTLGSTWPILVAARTGAGPTERVSNQPEVQIDWFRWPKIFLIYIRNNNHYHLQAWNRSWGWLLATKPLFRHNNWQKCLGRLKNSIKNIMTWNTEARVSGEAFSIHWGCYWLPFVWWLPWKYGVMLRFLRCKMPANATRQRKQLWGHQRVLEKVVPKLAEWKEPHCLAFWKLFGMQNTLKFECYRPFFHSYAGYRGGLGQEQCHN